jgi:1-acyl-sn-glycerol-3-phosphate acyltransferase
MAFGSLNAQTRYLILFERRLEFLCYYVEVTYIIQIIIQLPLRALYKIFYRLEVHDIENVKDIKDPVIFISNHLTLNDPWLAGTSLPFGSRFLKVHPVGGSKFNQPLKWFYDIGIIPFVYWLFGVVTLPKDGTREEKIQPIVDVLKKGESVLIYPEGGRAMEHGEVREFRLGTAEIFLRTGAQIVPIGIKQLTEPTRKIRLTFGKSFIPVSHTAEEITKELYNKVVELVK